jgi:hypothetical protein
MSQVGFSNRRLAGQNGVHHSVIDFLCKRLKWFCEHQRSRWHCKTTPREDRIIDRCAKRNRFATSARIQNEMNFGGDVSVRTVNRRLNEQRMHTRRPIKRP